MIKENPCKSERLEITADADIKYDNGCLSFKKDRNLFENYSLISTDEQLFLLSLIYSDDELLKIKDDVKEFYDVDAKIQDALFEEFDRLLTEGVRYEFS